MQSAINEILFATSHKVRAPLTTCLGLINLINVDDPLALEEIKIILPHLKTALKDLDEETRRLTILLKYKKLENKKNPGQI